MRAIDEYDEDLLPELPRAGDGDDEPASDEELGLVPELESADEGVGLDDAAGLEDDASSYALDLPPEDAVDDEQGVDAIPIEGLDEGDEYGWSDDGRGEEDHPFEGDLDLPGLSPLARDDGGEEGVDDLVPLGDGDDVPHLGPLEDDADEGDESTFGDDVTLMRFDEGPAGFPVLEPAGCEVLELGGGDIAACADRLVGGSAGLFWAEDRLSPVAGWPAGRRVSSVAVHPAERGLRVIGTPEGALRVDAEGAFVEANGWAGGGPLFVTGEQTALGERTRVWGRTPSGALFRSDDDGASWAGPLLFEPVVALAAPPSGGLVVLCAGRDAPPRLARTEDGGQSWTASEGPPLEGVGHLAALRDWVVVASAAGPFLSRDRGRRWARVPGLPATGPVGLAMEPGGLALYAVHLHEGRSLVVRHRPGGGESAAVLDVGPATVHAIEVRVEHGTRTRVQVASSAGFFRAHIRADLAP